MVRATLRMRSWARALRPAAAWRAPAGVRRRGELAEGADLLGVSSASWRRWAWRRTSPRLCRVRAGHSAGRRSGRAGARGRAGRRRSSGREQLRDNLKAKPKLGNSSQVDENRGRSLLQILTLSSFIRPDFLSDRILARRKFHIPCRDPTDVIQDTALFPLRRKIRCGMEMRLSLLTPGRSARWPRSWASATPSQAKAVDNSSAASCCGEPEVGPTGDCALCPWTKPASGIHLQKRCLVREAGFRECLFEQRRSKNKVRTHGN